MNAAPGQHGTEIPARDGLHFPALGRWNLNEAQTAMLAGVLVLTLLVYLRCLADGFVYDDHMEIVRNRYLGQWQFLWKSFVHDIWWFRAPAHLPQSSYYRPLQNVWLALNFHLLGRNPVGWHVMKILLHLCVVLLGFRLAQLLTGSAEAALLTALLFGVMPSHVESVVWISAIPEPLTAVLEFSALICFIQRARTRWRNTALSLMFFALAAFVHESAVVFPVLIAAYVFLFETGGESAGASSSEERPVSAGARLVTAVRSSAPFFSVSALYLAARALALGAGATFGLSHTKTTVGVDLVKRKIVPHRSPSNPPASLLLRTLPAVLCEYLAVLLLPWLAGPAHPVDFVKSAELTNFYLPLGTLALAVVAGFLAFRKSPRHRLYLFCACWWLVTLAPALSLNQVVSLVQDRYQYVPSFAVCLIVADLAIGFAQISIFSRRAIAAAATAVTLLYVALVWRAEPIWHDDVAMFGRCVEMFPNSPHYRQALADTLKERGDLQGATRQLAEAVRLEPNSAVAHYALGQLYERMGRTADAEREFHAYMALFAPWAVPRDGDSSETGVSPD
jgi:hypothetical protein